MPARWRKKCDATVVGADFLIAVQFVKIVLLRSLLRLGKTDMCSEVTVLTDHIPCTAMYVEPARDCPMITLFMRWPYW